MQFSRASRTNAGIVLVLTGVFCQIAPAQDVPAKDAPVREAQTIPPRATPADYQAHADAGKFTIAAEFAGHSVPTPEALFTTEDYVAVEVAFFGPPDSRLGLSYQDFSLRINGKKAVTPATGYTFVFKSLKDPEWEPPAAEKSKTSIGSGLSGKGPADPGNPAPTPKMPIGLERTMELRVQKAALPEGEHPLPQAGLIFFAHHGKTESIHSMELIYSGAAGKAILNLQ